MTLRACLVSDSEWRQHDHRSEVMLLFREEDYLMIPQDTQALFGVAQWIRENKNKYNRKIRELAGTEENYIFIRRELDRVEMQLQRARTVGAEATLTLVDWLTTLDYFHWQCAYCESRPFQVMSYIIHMPDGGTTPENCMPACHSCKMKRPENERVQEYLSILKDGSEKTEMDNGLLPPPSLQKRFVLVAAENQVNELILD